MRRRSGHRTRKGGKYSHKTPDSPKTEASRGPQDNEDADDVDIVAVPCHFGGHQLMGSLSGMQLFGVIPFAGLESSRMISGPILSSLFRNSGSSDTNTKGSLEYRGGYRILLGLQLLLPMAESLLGQSLGGVTKGD